MPAAVLVVLLHGACAGAPAGVPPGAVSSPLTTAPAAADDALTAAAADFDALRLEEAAVRLEGIVAAPTTPAPTRARALLLLGLTRAGLVDERGAEDAFSRALAIDPGLTVPADTSPKVRALFDRTRDGIASRPPPPAPSSPSVSPSVSPSSPIPPVSPSSSATPDPNPAAPAPSSDDGVLWTAGAGAALLATAGAAAVGVAVADHTLGTPVAGRTRAEHDQIRALGLTSLVGSAVLGIAGVAGLTAAALWSTSDGATP